MSFEAYWKILAKNWKLIIGCFFLMGAGAFIVSEFMTPIYQSTAVVQVAIRTGNNQADYTNLLASDQLVQTESQLAVSNPVLREVALNYQGLTAEQISKEVNSTPKLNTQLFEITVQDSSPTRAASLANAIATTLIKQQIQVVQQDNSQSQQQIQQDLDATRQQIDDTSKKIVALQGKGNDHGQLSILQSQLSDLQKHYSQWQTVLAQLALTQAQSGNFLRVAQPAQPAFDPVRPNKLLNTSAGLVGGLFLGMVLAVLFEQLDTHVRTAEALTQLLEWPVLGTVWKTRPADKSDVINPQGHDANVESYRILRTNLGFSSIDKPLHSMMVTSAMPGDGKSTIAANLAIFMAKAGKNTLLVDGDLRRPMQHQIFNLTADKKGLSNAVLAFGMPTALTPSSFPGRSIPTSSAHEASQSNTSSVSLEPFFHNVGIPNLRVMPSGPLPPNPSELLDSKAMQRFVVALVNCGIEVVIFDAPPILGLSDASILASKVDGTLLVVDVTRANKSHLKQIKSILAQAGAHVLGSVANKQRRSRGDTSYSYYYYDHPKTAKEQKTTRAESNPRTTNTLSSAEPVIALKAAKSVEEATLKHPKV